MHLSGFSQAFSVIQSALQETGSLHQAISSKTVQTALAVLKNIPATSSPALKEQAAALQGRIRAMGDSSSVAKEIDEVCSKVIGSSSRRSSTSITSRPRSGSTVSLDSLTQSSKVRLSMGSELGKELSNALNEERKGTISPRTGPLSESELTQLPEMHKFMNREVGAKRPSDRECKQFAILFLKALGNPDVNRQMKQFLAEMDGATTQIPKNSPPRAVVHMLMDFSFRTQGLENPTESVKKLENLLDSFFNNEPAGEKMSLTELGSLDSFRKCHLACSFIRDLGLEKHAPQLADLAKANEKTCLLIDQIENTLANSSNFRPGDIISTMPDRMKALRPLREDRRGEGLQRTLQGNIPVSHTAILFKGQDGREKMSHVVDQLQIDDFTLFDRLSSVTVRINVDASQEAKFQEITNAMHQGINPDSIQLPNSSVSKLKAGLASVVPILTRSSRSKNEGDLSREFNKLISSTPSDRTTPDMICSAWGALSQGAALDQLRFSPNPFSKQKLALTTPASLLQQLKGTISFVEPEPILQAIIKDDLTPPASIAALCTGISSTSNKAVQLEEVESPFGDNTAPPRNPQHLASKWATREESELVADEMAKKSKEEIQALVRKGREVLQNRQTFVSSYMQANPDALGLRAFSEKAMQDRGKISLETGGTGGTYMVRNEKGQKVLVVKPDDESPLSLHNPKQKASPLVETKLVRATIPVGQDALRAALTYKVAERIGLTCTPKTDVAILTSDAFHDVTDGLVPTRFKQLGKAVRTKVCSVQEFVPDAITIKTFREQQEGLKATRHITDRHIEHNIVEGIDKQSLEDVALLACLSGATDVNEENVLLARSGDDSSRYKMVLIDTPLSWPTSKGEFYVCFKGASKLTDRPLSEETTNRIRFLPVADIEKQMRACGMSEKVIEDALGRVKIMQQVVTHESATLSDLLDSISQGRDCIAAKSEPQPSADELIAGALEGGVSTLVNPSRSPSIDLE